ncbi:MULTISPECIES: polyprenyl synthetase family protein [Halomonadaceae]|nr:MULTISPECIES: polyprenyl synthetase family protein [Halomonas]
MKEHVLGLTHGPATEAATYQIRSGGSFLRARLALASGHSFGRSIEYRVAAAAACELIHNASLVHDDLSDGDEQRRGKATVWRQFGEDVALCTGDLLLCAAFGVAAELETPEESRALTQQLSRLTSCTIVGQSREVASSHDQHLPGLRQYLETTSAKTVPLIELPLMSGVVAARADAVTQAGIVRLARSVGLAYQIIDDLDDLTEETPALHPFHAWHHHRPVGQRSAGARFRRATQHAFAALNRAQRALDELERHAVGGLAGRLQPLLSQLESRAIAHRRTGSDEGGAALHGVSQQQ